MERLDAVEVRELDVHQHEIGRVLRRYVDRLAARRRLERSVSGRDKGVAEQLHVQRVVLDHEDLLARHRGRPPRQRKGEGAPATELALEPDPSAVELHEPLRERKAEARPFALPDPRLALLELLEDPVPILGSDARTGVGDGNPDLAVDPRRAHVDLPTGGRELHGIREQVEDDLLDPSLVTVDHIDLGVRGERDADPFLRGALAHHHHAALERLPQRERVNLQLDLSGLDLGEVEDVVDQREQMVPRGGDVVEVLRLLRIHGPDHLVAQHLGEADDRVERRPELVGHVRQELRLVPARRLELGVETPQLVVHPVDVGAQRSELVSVIDFDVSEKVSGCDRGNASVDPLEGPDQRPR